MKNNNKYIYAKRIYNEDSYIYFEDLKDYLLSNMICIYGNKGYTGVNGGIIEFIYDDIINYSDYELQVYYKNNIANLIIDNFKSYNGIKLNVKQALKINSIIKDYAIKNSSYRYEEIADILTIVFNEKYISYCMRGNSQGEWNYLFIKEKYKDSIDYIEGVYFNTGYELALYVTNEEEDKPFNNIEDVDYFYTVKWRNEDIKKDILNYYGFKEEEIERIIYIDIHNVSYKQVLDVEYEDPIEL